MEGGSICSADRTDINYLKSFESGINIADKSVFFGDTFVIDFDKIGIKKMDELQKFFLCFLIQKPSATQSLAKSGSRPQKDQLFKILRAAPKFAFESQYFALKELLPMV